MTGKIHAFFSGINKQNKFLCHYIIYKNYYEIYKRSFDVRFELRSSLELIVDVGLLLETSKLPFFF